MFRYTNLKSQHRQFLHSKYYDSSAHILHNKVRSLQIMIQKVNLILLLPPLEKYCDEV